MIEAAITRISRPGGSRAFKVEITRRNTAEDWSEKVAERTFERDQGAAVDWAFSWGPNIRVTFDGLPLALRSEPVALVAPPAPAAKPADHFAVLTRIREEATAYDDKMGDLANDGKDSRPPDGDDYNALMEILMSDWEPDPVRDAAADMLDVLKGLAGMWDPTIKPPPGMSETPYMVTAQKIHAAIAKAEGRPVEPPFLVRSGTDPIKEIMTSRPPLGGSLPVIVRSMDEVRYLGHASNERVASRLATEQGIFHTRVSIAEIEDDSRRFFLIRL
jgi:hypothetical protein